MDSIKVAAAIIVRNDRVLATHRDGSHGHVGWEFPGGKLEEGESAEQALRREIEEELGLKLATMWDFDTFEHDYEDFHLSLACLVCPLDDEQEPKPTEHDEICWLSRNELLDLDWLEADREVALRLGTFWEYLLNAEHL